MKWQERPLDGHRDDFLGLAGSTSRSASAACRAGGWSKSTGRNPPGKTTLALHTVAEVRRRAASAPHRRRTTALDPVYARKLGVTSTNCIECLRSACISREQPLESAITPRAASTGCRVDHLHGRRIRAVTACREIRDARLLSAVCRRWQHDQQFVDVDAELRA